MPGFKGRAILYPGLLIAGWIVVRSITLSAAPGEQANEAPERRVKKLAAANAVSTVILCPSPLPRLAAQTMPGQILSRTRNEPGRKTGNEPSTAWIGPLQPFSTGADFDLAGEASRSAFAALPHSQERDPGHGAAFKPRRLHLYGYSFWRQGAAGAAIAPNAQYGGSQYGAIATWDSFGSAGSGPALLLRGSGTPDGTEREIALGARWQPRRGWPLSVSLERRFRANSPDSFAAYVAGGVDRVPLIGKFALDAYGQAGYALGGRSSAFVDAQARVQHPLAEPLGIPLRIGTGAWIGGQKGAFRADIGPTLSAEIDSPISRFTLQLDWRKRITGNAAPGDGAALTVSTGF